MKIDLINDYFIEVDSMNYTLKKKCVSEKTGKETERVFGYFTTLEGALDKFLRLNQIDVVSDMGMGMYDYVKRIEESNKAAVQAIKRALDAVKK